MGINNRQRRRAKQAKRRKHHADGRFGRPSAADPGPAGERDGRSVEAVILAAVGVGDAEPEDRDALVAWLIVQRPGSDRAGQVASTLTRLLTELAGAALRGGWEPRDLDQLLRRRVGAGAVAISTPGLTVAARRSASADHQRHWDEQLGALSADPRPLDPGSARWTDDVTVAISALHLLAHVPVLPDLHSLGRPSHPVRSSADEPMLGKVRSLLSKAESSEFPAESEALMSKAQELITRHSLERAVVEAAEGVTRPSVIARRCWLDDPYLPAKGLLLATVSAANRCRAVTSTDLGFVTVVGHPGDVDVSEVLFTSLLVQAIRQMSAGPSDARQQARSRRPAFRRSYLLAYASRIGARLAAADSAAVQAAADQLGSRLLPVLATQRQCVEGTVHRLFPRLTEQRFSAIDLAGWAAGTAAADLADLAVSPMLEEMTG